VPSSANFTLDDGFVAGYSLRDVNWGPVGEVVYRRTYSRDDEEWHHTIRRVVEGTYTWQKRHCAKFNLPWSDDKATQSAMEMYERMFTFKFLPPGRGLWMMGTKYVEEHGGAALNNCAFISTRNLADDFADAFCFVMDLSMLGVGVGFDTLGAGTLLVEAPIRAGNHRVSDSREGWVSLLRQCLEAYTGRDFLPVTVDYSKVRPAGSPISGFGGTSSGHKPLQQLVADVQTILDPIVGKPITSGAIVDLANAVGRCVVSGNVRRSAEIALGSSWDEDFLNLKTPKAQKERPWYWCSNNSVVDPYDYEAIAGRIAETGEPGIFWLRNAQEYGRFKDEANDDDYRAAGTNPCSEQTLESRELCCLVETFPSLHESLEDYLRTLKFAYLYAKTVTTIPTHDPRINAVMLRNRRIGCSQSGITEAIAKLGAHEYLTGWCDQGYDYLEDLDEQYSDWLCIPRSIKITSVKPSGTVSKLPGVSEGIHYPISEHYWQVIRFATDSPYLPALSTAGYECHQTKEPNTTAVYFPCKVRHYSKSRQEASMWEQMELVAQMQYYWADNQVSATVTFAPAEAKDIPAALAMYQTRLKSVSLMPLDSTHYEHMPQQKMSKTEYERAVKGLKPLQLVSKNEVIDDMCDSTGCSIEHLYKED